ncbi:MAG: hypothetical protein M1833_001849 [Piccolia ochrophora]|nr:MAG: hypothetical protein M1833_001849 [Piccolia ochrophora]
MFARIACLLLIVFEAWGEPQSPHSPLQTTECSSILTRRAQPVLIKFQYDGLKAGAMIRKAPTRSKGFWWEYLSHKIREDSRALPEGKNLSYYDVWPVVDRVHGSAKFELDRIDNDNNDRWIEKGLLDAFTQVFQAMEDGFSGWQSSYHGVIMLGAQNIFEFRLYKVPESTATTEKISDISRIDMRNIYRGKRAILDYTTVDDLLVFIGNTAGYFFAAFNLENDGAQDHRHIRLIPFSGRTRAVPSMSKTPGFRHYVDDILRPAFSDLPPGRVVLIDKSFQGAGLDLFLYIFHESGVFTERPYFINILTQSLLDHQSMIITKSVVHLGQVLLPSEKDLMRFSQADIGRVVPPYPLQYWHLPVKRIQYPDWDKAVGILCKIRAYEWILCRSESVEKVQLTFLSKLISLHCVENLTTAMAEIILGAVALGVELTRLGKKLNRCHKTLNHARKEVGAVAADATFLADIFDIFDAVVTKCEKAKIQGAIKTKKKKNLKRNLSTQGKSILGQITMLLENLKPLRGKGPPTPFARNVARFRWLFLKSAVSLLRADLDSTKLSMSLYTDLLSLDLATEEVLVLTVMPKEARDHM